MHGAVAADDNLRGSGDRNDTHERVSTREEHNDTLKIFHRIYIPAIATPSSSSPPPPPRAHAGTRNPYNSPIAFSRVRIHAIARHARATRAPLDHTRTRPDMLTVAEFIFQKRWFLVYEA